MSLITLLDQALVTSTLRDTLGYSAAETSALYGQYTFGMTLFQLPPSFIYPVSVSLMPAITAALTRQDRAAAGRAVGGALKLTTLAALPAGAGLSVLAEPILLLLYPRRAGYRPGGSVPPDVFGPCLRVRVPDGGHQRRAASLWQSRCSRCSRCCAAA